MALLQLLTDELTRIAMEVLRTLHHIQQITSSPEEYMGSADSCTSTMRMLLAGDEHWFSITNPVAATLGAWAVRKSDVSRFNDACAKWLVTALCIDAAYARRAAPDVEVLFGIALNSNGTSECHTRREALKLARGMCTLFAVAPVCAARPSRVTGTDAEPKD
jgi:hypothetical protein